jgi:hypothetical protein
MFSNSAVKPDGDRVPYAAPPVPFMQPDMVHSGVLSNWLEDDRMWVPQTATVSFKPCLLSASNGYFVNILRVRQKDVLSRHRHAGAVHALVLRRRWHYLEHDGWRKKDRISSRHRARRTLLSSLTASTK